MKQNVFNFKVVIMQDEDGMFVADVPAIPGCHTQGETYEEAIKNIEEAIRLCLDVAEEDESYRDSIDFTQQKTPRFFGMSDIFVPTPRFL
jgi:predicted RNase H-like HicB family nuclease